MLFLWQVYDEDAVFVLRTDSLGVNVRDIEAPLIRAVGAFAADVAALFVLLVVLSVVLSRDDEIRAAYIELDVLFLEAWKLGLHDVFTALVPYISAAGAYRHILAEEVLVEVIENVEKIISVPSEGCKSIHNSYLQK